MDPSIGVRSLTFAARAEVASRAFTRNAESKKMTSAEQCASTQYCPCGASGDHPVAENNGAWQTDIQVEGATVATVDSGNPQSWNRNAYVLDNPASAIDPLGLNSAGCSGATSGGLTCSFLVPPGYDAVLTDVETHTILGNSGGTLNYNLVPSYTQSGFDGQAYMHEVWVPMEGSPNIPSHYDGSGMGSTREAARSASPASAPPGSEPLKPTKYFFPWPPLSHAHYCGPGTGGGIPNDQVDQLCEQHDQCYQNAGMDWWATVKSGAHMLPDEQAQAKAACDAKLCAGLPLLVTTSSQENGNAFWTGAFFGCVP